jgi:hypothetical protein
MDRLLAVNQASRQSATRLILVLSVAVIVGILFVFNPATSAFYPFCPLHRLTGLLCPGCGSLRATHELLHGHLLAAFHLNALFVLALPLVASLAARWIYRRYRGQPVSFGISGKPLWAGFIITVLFGVFRNF